MAVQKEEEEEEEEEEDGALEDSLDDDHPPFRHIDTDGAAAVAMSSFASTRLSLGESQSVVVFFSPFRLLLLLLLFAVRPGVGRRIDAQ